MFYIELKKEHTITLALFAVFVVGLSLFTYFVFKPGITGFVVYSPDDTSIPVTGSHETGKWDKSKQIPGVDLAFIGEDQLFDEKAHSSRIDAPRQAQRDDRLREDIRNRLPR